jgi:hypothetical protein
MVGSNGLLPVVMGIGLAALSSGTLAAARRSGEESRWREPLFVFAVLLIGLAVFGAALFELGWSIESGRKLPPAEERAENWLIVALVLLLVTLAARSAWMTYFYSPDDQPWDRGHFDRWPPLLGFAAASLGALLIGLAVDAIVVVLARFDPPSAVVLVAATLALGCALAWGVLRLMTGGDPSPAVHMRSRRAQLRMLSALDGATGEWAEIQVSAVGRLDPPLALSAVVWTTSRGMYFRTDDAYALVRYHEWVANHLTSPTYAVHAQRLMLANPTRRADRHIVIKPWSGRRTVWLDVVRMNRGNRSSLAGSASPESAAGLVHLPYRQLSAAGLQITSRCVHERLSHKAIGQGRATSRTAHC